jgi:hypothetical protein
MTAMMAIPPALTFLIESPVSVEICAMTLRVATLSGRIFAPKGRCHPAGRNRTSDAFAIGSRTVQRSLAGAAWNIREKNLDGFAIDLGFHSAKSLLYCEVGNRSRLGGSRWAQAGRSV